LSKIKSSTVSPDLLEKIKNPDLLEGEDILIEDDDGYLLGVIIQPQAYEFFLKKIEERENELDASLSEPYIKTAKSLSDLLG
jgi:hypothetical protein